MCWQSKWFYWEGHLGGEQEGRGTPENSSATVLGFMVMGLVLWWWVVFSQSFWLRVLAGGACLVQPREMPERRILGSSRICGVSFWPFLNSSWWWLISSFSSPGPLVVKRLMQMVTMVPGQGGWFSQCASSAVLLLACSAQGSTNFMLLTRDLWIMCFYSFHIV